LRKICKKENCRERNVATEKWSGATVGGGMCMGNTNKKKSDIRVNQTVRLNSYEKSCLRIGAATAGMNESEFIRSLIVHGNVDKDNLKDRQNLIRQISGVATNINQVVHRINGQQRYYFSDGEELKKQLKRLQDLMKEVLNLWR
jgi:hypothetical protein